MSPLWWIRIRGLWMLPERIDWLRGKLDLVLMGGAMFSKYLIQFSVDGWGSQAMEEVMNIMANSLKRSHGSLSAPDPAAGHCRPTPLLETPGHSQASRAQSPVGSLLFSPGSWWAWGFICALQESVFPVLCKFCSQIPLASKVKIPGSSQSLCLIQRFGNLLSVLELS